jgi:hypothetical protein
MNFYGMKAIKISTHHILYPLRIINAMSHETKNRKDDFPNLKRGDFHWKF